MGQSREAGRSVGAERRAIYSQGMAMRSLLSHGGYSIDLRISIYFYIGFYMFLLRSQRFSMVLHRFLVLSMVLHMFLMISNAFLMISNAF